jgi:hypothetical protein
VRCYLVLVIPRPDRQCVADENPAGRRLPRRGQDVRARLVDPCRRVVDPERPEPKASGLPVKQAAEHARRVEAGHAKPVDRSIGSHERAGVAIGQERVIGDRRERRRRGRTLLLGLFGRLAGRRSGLGHAHAVIQVRIRLLAIRNAVQKRQVGDLLDNFEQIGTSRPKSVPYGINVIADFPMSMPSLTRLIELSQ